LVKTSYRENVLNSKGDYIKNLQNKLEYSKGRIDRLSKKLEDDRQTRIRLGMEPHSVLHEDDEKEIKKLQVGMKRLQGRIKNVDKVFEFAAEHEPHTYGMNFLDDKRDKIEEIVRRNNPSMKDDEIDTLMNEIEWTVDNIANASLPYIEYREDISSETGIPIGKIPEHPWKTSLTFLKKTLVKDIQKDAEDKKARLSGKSAWDIVNEVL